MFKSKYGFPYKLLSFLFILLLSASCNKYVEIKTDESFDVINSADDLKYLLDNSSVFNTSQPNTPETVSDNYFINTSDWQNLGSLTHKNLYIWGKDVYNETKNNDWFYAYRTVLNSNIVLDNMDKAKGSASTGEINAIKAAALFYRSWSLFQVIQIWTAPYDPAKASQLLGIPLRTSSDFNIVSKRASLEESYTFLIKDLQQSLHDLPPMAAIKTRPSRAAAYALLSRIFLSRQEYEKAGLYADSCLQIQNTLLDYNLLPVTASAPFSKFNEEVIYQAISVGASILNNPRGKIDTVLYGSYLNDDLRKKAYFRNTGNYQVFKGSYDGSSSLFSGIASDELYLTKAECLARAGKTQEAMDLLNTLLVKRFATGYFSPLTAETPEEALSVILTERRKELVYRHLRWADLKRLSREPTQAKTLQRIIDNTSYTLAPGDSRYAFQIPLFVVQNSEVVQNP